MNDVKLDRMDLKNKLDECHAMALFLADAVNLILEDTKIYRAGNPVPFGASTCIIMLSEKIAAIEQAI